MGFWIEFTKSNGEQSVPAFTNTSIYYFIFERFQILLSYIWWSDVLSLFYKIDIFMNAKFLQNDKLLLPESLWLKLPRWK